MCCVVCKKGMILSLSLYTRLNCATPGLSLAWQSAPLQFVLIDVSEANNSWITLCLCIWPYQLLHVWPETYCMVYIWHHRWLTSLTKASFGIGNATSASTHETADHIFLYFIQYFRHVSNGLLYT